MKKVLKMISKIFLALLALVLAFTLVTFIIHVIKTKRETEIFKEKGYCNLVSVGDHSLNVISFGNEDGKHTIVSLAGLGMSDYSITQRKMTAAFEDDNRVVFIDRAGYGFSGDTKEDMTLEFIVEDYRKALKNAGIETPVVLMAHSAGGAYANYWTCNYPEEIEAVILVDGTQLSDDILSEDADKGSVDLSDRTAAFFAGLGFARYVLRDVYYVLPSHTEEEQKLCDALELMTYSKIALSSESCYSMKNYQKAWTELTPTDCPKLYICSSWGVETKEEFIEYLKWNNSIMELNHKEVTLDPDSIPEEKIREQLDVLADLRENTIYPYAEKMGNCKVVLLGGDHCIYEQKPEKCGKIIEEFLSELD